MGKQAGRVGRGWGEIGKAVWKGRRMVKGVGGLMAGHARRLGLEDIPGSL